MPSYLQQAPEGFPSQKGRLAMKEGAGPEEHTITEFLLQANFSPELRKGLFDQWLQLTPNKGLPLWCKVQAIIEKLCLPI